MVSDDRRRDPWWVYLWFISNSLVFGASFFVEGPWPFVLLGMWAVSFLLLFVVARKSAAKDE